MEKVPATEKIGNKNKNYNIPKYQKINLEKFKNRNSTINNKNTEETKEKFSENKILIPEKYEYQKDNLKGFGHQQYASTSLPNIYPFVKLGKIPILHFFILF